MGLELHSSGIYSHGLSNASDMERNVDSCGKRQREWDVLHARDLEAASFDCKIVSPRREIGNEIESRGVGRRLCRDVCSCIANYHGRIHDDSLGVVNDGTGDTRSFALTQRDRGKREGQADAKSGTK